MSNYLFHTYYLDKDYYEDGERIADLDRDDINSYGPEMTTVRKMNSQGKYSFYVHDYTNRYNTDGSELSLSDAKVVVYNGDGWLATTAEDEIEPKTESDNDDTEIETQPDDAFNGEAKEE